MTDSEGSWLVADRYALLDRVGSGGMGTVWRATDQLLGRTVAMKEVHLHGGGEERATQVQRAHREARAIARISHPGVINIHDLVEHNGQLWLVMEFVEGPSLAQHLAATGPMAPSTVAEIGRQLLDSLEAVHATGALHRDIKPGNVLLRRDGRAVLCDFGIAALLGAESLTTTDGVVGSLQYIAPERLSSGAAVPASDLFSLGATLYALLTGRSPFARPEVAAVLHAVTYAQPELPDVPEPLHRLLEALLRKEPAERPSVAEAAEMVRHTAEAPPFTASVPQGRTSGARGGRLLRPVAISTAVLVAGGIVTGLLMNRSTDGEAPPKLDRVDAVMPVPSDDNVEAPGEYWMFTDGRYSRVRASNKEFPVEERLTDPAPLSEWNTIGRLPGFKNGIDAVMRVPDRDSDYWVFSDDEYIRIRVEEDGLKPKDRLMSDEPKSIDDWADAFNGLPSGGIDAVMPVPDNRSQVWVFSGRYYVRVELEGGESGRKSLHGQETVDGWENTLGTFDEFKKGINEVMPVPNNRDQYWMFSGGQYMKLELNDDYEDEVVADPSPLAVR